MPCAARFEFTILEPAVTLTANCAANRLAGFRKFTLRRQGNVPGDIVYHYDAAHLLHSFTARAAVPCFYDAIEEDGLEDLVGHLVLRCPEPLARNILGAGDAGLMVVAP
jgi:hypothetical protein